jgi:hypothetical protein
MSTQSPSIQISFTKIFPIFLNNINKKKIYNKEEMIYLKIFFYRFFYVARANNDALQRNDLDIDGKVFKKMLRLIVKKFNNYVDYKHLSYQFVLSTFLDFLTIRRLDDLTSIYFTDMNISLNKKNKTILLNTFKNKFTDIPNTTIGLALFTLLRFQHFSKKEAIPFELFSILIYDSHLHYIANKDMFSNGTAAYKNFLMEECITKRLEYIGRKVIINENNEVMHLLEPPRKNEFKIQLMLENDPTYSLPLICHYFSHKSWYDFFLIDYQNMNPDDFYKFNITW